MGSGGTTALLPPDKFFSNLPNFNLKSGADTQSRTGDLTLTKGALYQLSHISTLNLMPGSLWRASCPPPSGPLLRNVQIRSRRICPTRESVHRQTTDKTKGPVFRLSLLFYLMSGSSLLSHGETPHYHRRYGVSLLSSAWGQVGPPR